jgi:hypothetical protein
VTRSRESEGVTRSRESEGRKDEKDGMSRASRPLRLLLRLRMTAERLVSRECLDTMEPEQEKELVAGGAVAGPLSWFSTLLWSINCACHGIRRGAQAEVSGVTKGGTVKYLLCWHVQH